MDQVKRFLVVVVALAGLVAKGQSPAKDYAVVAPDASWCWFSDPRAVYHKGSIYFAYITRKGDVMISSRNLRSKAEKTFMLHKELQVDDHNVPSILFLPDGRLLTFYTEHNGRFFTRKSLFAGDIGSWEAERVIPFGGTKITYSHPVMLRNENNRIYVFWRGSDWRPTLSYSDDLGQTWSKSQGLIESKGARNRPYLKVVSDNKSRIDLVFTDGHPSIEPTNSVYHVYYEKGNFYQTNGELIKPIGALPILHASVKKVYDGTATGVRSWISDVALDAKNRPVIVYTRYPAETDHRYHYAAWNGTKWLDQELCKAGGSMCVVPTGQKNREPHYSAGISLDHQDPRNVYLARPVNGIFEIEHWQPGPTGDWKVERITSGSEIPNMRPYVASGHRRKNPVVLWMTGQYTHYTDFRTQLRINELQKR